MLVPQCDGGGPAVVVGLNLARCLHCMGFCLCLSHQLNELYWHEVQFSIVCDAKTLAEILKVTFSSSS